MYINLQLQSLYERTIYTAEQQIENKKMQKFFNVYKNKKLTKSKGRKNISQQIKLLLCQLSILRIRAMEIKLILSIQDSETTNKPEKCLS